MGNDEYETSRKYMNQDVLAVVLAFFATLTAFIACCIRWPIVATVAAALLFVGFPVTWLVLRRTVLK